MEGSNTQVTPDMKNNEQIINKENNMNENHEQETIDQETQRIIADQMARAKQILTEHADGHHRLAELLIEREVITSEDVESILGPRPWKSRGDELLEANAQIAEAEKPKKRTTRKKKNNETNPS